MLGKPIEGSTELFTPTAAHPLGPFLVWRATQDIMELPWEEFGVQELTALPTIRPEHWLPKLEAADALLVGGGKVTKGKRDL
jgi:dipeptidase E